MIDIYLVRHGETDMNLKGVYCGWTDCGLNSKGIEQGKRINELLKNTKFDRVIASPLKRAVETAELITKPGSNILETDERIKEINFGKWEGLHYKEISSTYKEHWEKWCNDWKRTAAPFGESFEDLYLRIESFVNELIKADTDSKILIVAHQGCLRLIAVLLLTLSPDYYWSFDFEQGAYSILSFEKDNCCIKKINCKG